MTSDDIVDLAWEHKVPWLVAWRALGPKGVDRDEAIAMCEKALSSLTVATEPRSDHT